MLRRLLPLGLFGAIVALACGSEPGSTFPDGTSSSSSGGQFPPDGGGIIGGGDTKDGPPPATPVECKKMDIIFVIDNSVSMKQEQDALITSIPGFIKLIEEYKTAADELLDYRIGILSTDVSADQGRMRKSRGADPDTQSCNPLDNDKPWLERTDGTESLPVSDVFACRARLGTTGSPVELPLESTRLALYERITDQSNVLKSQNEPFLRKDALLAIVVITDEDEGGGDNDQTLKPAPLNTPEFYAGKFDDVKEGYRARWATAVIAGEEQCTSALGSADKAVRLKKLVEANATNGVFDSICKDDFSGSLKRAFDVFSNACKAFPGVK
ncbi:MAG: hypothetical protein KIT84_14995 [Labilithrix sp.]|nr:hypothetical protein [Labilithrix sp.]MCW5812330.1 hypothetical protein [Labilithrix sp.]